MITWIIWITWTSLPADQEKCMLQNQYSCWWPGTASNQGIYSHGIDKLPWNILASVPKGLNSDVMLDSQSHCTKYEILHYYWLLCMIKLIILKYFVHFFAQNHFQHWQHHKSWWVIGPLRYQIHFVLQERSGINIINIMSIYHGNLV